MLVLPKFLRCSQACKANLFISARAPKKIAVLGSARECSQRPFVTLCFQPRSRPRLLEYAKIWTLFCSLLVSGNYRDGKKKFLLAKNMSGAEEMIQLLVLIKVLKKALVKTNSWIISSAPLIFNDLGLY